MFCPHLFSAQLLVQTQLVAFPLNPRLYRPLFVRVLLLLWAPEKREESLTEKGQRRINRWRRIAKPSEVSPFIWKTGKYVWRNQHRVEYIHYIFPSSLDSSSSLNLIAEGGKGQREGKELKRYLEENQYTRREIIATYSFFRT